MLELKLLGGFRLLRDGQPLPLPTRKCQALLAWLSIGGRSTRGRLAALLWPQADEAGARRNLRVELHRLRQAGLADALHEADDSLELRRVESDLSAFESAWSGPETPNGAEIATGQLLEGFHLPDAAAFGDWLAAQRERVSRLQRHALQRRAESAEASAQWQMALADRLRLIEGDDLQEAQYLAAMRLHARLGERERAMLLYERCRSTLGRELGLRPMPQTQALAEAIRKGDADGLPDLSLPAGSVGAVKPDPLRSARGPADDRPDASPVTAATPVLPPHLPFAGREPELAAGLAAWRAGRPLRLIGPGGVGKSRLARELAAAWGDAQPWVLQAQPGDEALPFATVRRQVRALLLRTDATGLAEGIRNELTRLVPELGSAPPPLGSEADRARFMDAVAQAVVALWPPAAKVWLLEDWHLADSAGSALLLHAWQTMRACGTAPALLIAMRAPADAHDNPVERDPVATTTRTLTLAALAPAAVAAIVEHLSGSPGALFAQRLHQATGGHPLFLLQTLQQLEAQGLLLRDRHGHWATPFDEATADYRELPVPASVHEAVRERVSQLGDPVRRLLEAASLLGGRFSLAQLADCTTLGEFEALDALEQAARAQLVQEADEAGWRFAHDLLREALAQGLGAERRRLLHTRLARGLQRSGAGPGEVAHHFEQAGLLREAGPMRLAAGLALQRLYAHAEALTEFDRALRDGVPPEQRVALHHGRIEALRHLGHHDARLAETQLLRDLARQQGDADTEADALIQIALLHGDRGHRAAARQAAEQAVACGAPGPTARLRALRIAAWTAMTEGDGAAAEQHLEKGQALADALDPAAATSMLSIRCRLVHDRGDFDSALALHERAAAHPGFGLQPMIQSQVLSDGARVLMALGRRDEGLARQNESLAVAERVGAGPAVLVARHNLIVYRVHAGQVGEAEVEFQRLPPAEAGALEAYVRHSLHARLHAEASHWHEALASNALALQQADAMADTLLRRQERVLRSRWLLAAGDAAGALRQAEEAAAIEPVANRSLLSSVAAKVEAELTLHAAGTSSKAAGAGAGSAPPRQRNGGQATAASRAQRRQRLLAAGATLEAALRSALPEEDIRGAQEHAALALAQVQWSLGEHQRARAQLAGIRSSAALQQRAATLLAAWGTAAVGRSLESASPSDAAPPPVAEP